MIVNHSSSLWWGNISFSKASWKKQIRELGWGLWPSRLSSSHPLPTPNSRMGFARQTLHQSAASAMICYFLLCDPQSRGRTACRRQVWYRCRQEHSSAHLWDRPRPSSQVCPLGSSHCALHSAQGGKRSCGSPSPLSCQLRKSFPRFRAEANEKKEKKRKAECVFWPKFPLVNTRSEDRETFTDTVYITSFPGNADLWASICHQNVFKSMTLSFFVFSYYKTIHSQCGNLRDKASSGKKMRSTTIPPSKTTFWHKSF